MIIHFFSTDVATICVDWHSAVQLLVPYGDAYMLKIDSYHTFMTVAVIVTIGYDYGE